MTGLKQETSLLLDKAIPSTQSNLPHKLQKAGIKAVIERMQKKGACHVVEGTATLLPRFIAIAGCVLIKSHHVKLQISCMCVRLLSLFRMHIALCRTPHIGISSDAFTPTDPANKSPAKSVTLPGEKLNSGQVFRLDECIPKAPLIPLRIIHDIDTSQGEDALLSANGFVMRMLYLSDRSSPGRPFIIGMNYNERTEEIAHYPIHVRLTKTYSSVVATALAGSNPGRVRVVVGFCTWPAISISRVRSALPAKSGQVPGVKSDVILLEHVMTAIIIEMGDGGGQCQRIFDARRGFKWETITEKSNGCKVLRSGRIGSNAAIRRERYGLFSFKCDFGTRAEFATCLNSNPLASPKNGHRDNWEVFNHDYETSMTGGMGVIKFVAEMNQQKIDSVFVRRALISRIRTRLIVT
ncbi:hypothetical protein TcasGA2_TC003659 [Tribolium castaneum]|uniref:Uncharacterized protein n=1 Tax=Tribolium castaneum TaxID=7070 RepID=D6WDH0_TRICA|nr:hypothetical protein TcasGA2_TC003659 [Tribolium castaneum]